MLKGHPAVCFAVPKEPHYFSRLPEGWSPERVPADYLPAYFRHWDGAPATLGEGSPSYLYSDRAIGAIEACFPEARYIVMARSPLELVTSHHKRMLYTLDEDEPDLAEAWALQGQRRRGERVPRRCRDPRLLDYEGVGRVGARCEALLRRVGRDGCGSSCSRTSAPTRSGPTAGRWRSWGFRTTGGRRCRGATRAGRFGACRCTCSCPSRARRWSAWRWPGCAASGRPPGC